MSNPQTYKTSRALVSTVVAVVAFALPSIGFAQEDPQAAIVDFDAQIQPIFDQHCVDCHGADEQEGGLRLDESSYLMVGGDSGEPAVVPGDSAASFLVQLITGEIEDLAMPYGGDPLPADQIELIRRWIDQGAPLPNDQAPVELLDRELWSLQELKRPAVPDVGSDWSANPIDSFIFERLQAAGLQPSPPADRVSLLRRLSLDMLGLPPTPEELKQFRGDESPAAFARQVERALASENYGERWARHWLDVVRFAESDGFETNHVRENAWRYRDYVIDALNRDKPYDQFIREQIAGDALGVDEATGFLVGGPYDIVKSPDITLTLMQRQDELADMVNTTATTFLGLTVGCARCHNHKFDPILQKDYYALQAMFAGVRHGERAFEPRDDTQRLQQLQKIDQSIAKLQHRLAQMQPTATMTPTVFMDDRAGDRVVHLQTPNGEGDNPVGSAAGQRHDLGDKNRFPNISTGHYTWWDNIPGQDVMVYRPQVVGSFELWISWGCGFDTHTSSATYWLDHDGDLSTQHDQQPLATIDQRYSAVEQATVDTTPTLPSQPLWSGLLAVGSIALTEHSAIVLRGGDDRTAITADLIVLQQAIETSMPASPAVRLPVNGRLNIDRFAPTPAKYIRFEIARSSTMQPCIDELEVFGTDSHGGTIVNLAAAAEGSVATASGVYNDGTESIHQLHHVNDGRYGNSYSWIAKENMNAWVQIELPQTQTISEIHWSRDRLEQYSDRLPIDYQIQVAEEPGNWKTVATSRDRIPLGTATGDPPILVASLSGEVDIAAVSDQLQQLQMLRAEREQLAAGQRVYAGTFEQPEPVHRLYRGEPGSPREEVAPDVLSVIGTLQLDSQMPEQQRRAALADWIASPQNPLTARVMVNRIWHYHFGTGLVPTPSDFGTNGVPPSHPELLDWLAAEFIDSGWSIKHIHRLILNSNTYRQSSLPREDALRVDAQARLLWRFPPRRLEAEAIRDSVLAVSGDLNHSTGGPGFLLFDIQKETVWHYFPVDSYSPDQLRRMVYMTKLRQEQDDVFGALDCPDGNQTMPRRNQSTTPLQALNLLNSQFILRQAESLASRLQRECDSDADKADRAFQLCFGRLPTDDERSDTVDTAKQIGWPAVCRALFNSNEFLFLP